MRLCTFESFHPKRSTRMREGGGGGGKSYDPMFGDAVPFSQIDDDKQEVRRK